MRGYLYALIVVSIGVSFLLGVAQLLIPESEMAYFFVYYNLIALPLIVVGFGLHKLIKHGNPKKHSNITKPFIAYILLMVVFILVRVVFL